MCPLYLHGRQQSKVHVQICVNALMLYSWPSALQLAWTGTSPCLWFSKPAEAGSRMWIDLNAALLKTIMKKNKWIWWKTITEMDSMVYLACVFRFFLCVSACQMGVFLFWLKESHSDVKSQFRWPAPGLFDRHTAILTKCDSPFSEPAPLKFLTPTPRWMAIGFLFWLIVVKPRVEMEKKKSVTRV